jgi:myo-inositol-1(or 4)-monophosphatase
MDLPDPDLCASLVRGIADQLAMTSVTAGADEDIRAILLHMRAINRRSEHAMCKALRAHFPGIGWFGEASNAKRPFAGRQWVYDPIDGAYHYFQGLPHWSSTLALVENGTPILSIVYDPSTREMFSAVRGAGAQLNGTHVRASARPSLRVAVLGTSIAPVGAITVEEQHRALDTLGRITRETFVVRQMAAGSLQLAHVAAGRLDGYWEVGDDLNDWLAGALLVQEAGGIVSDLAGTSLGAGTDGILAGGPAIHPALISLLQQGHRP